MKQVTIFSLLAKKDFETWLNTYTEELCLGKHFGLEVKEMVQVKVNLEG
jgi:hypothetical protein